MAYTTIRTEGFEELKHALTELPQEVGKKIMSDAMKLGGEEIRSAIAVRTPVGRTRRLRQSITLRPHNKGSQWFATRMGAGIQYDIGPEYSRAKKGYHGHLVEYGTKPHDIIAGMKYKTLKSGRIKAKESKSTVLADKKRGLFFGKKVTVSAKPHPFLRPGFDASKTRAVNTIHNKLSREIESSFERLTNG